MSHSNTFSLADEGIVRMKLPALVNQIIVVRSVISNKVSVLVGRIIHAGCAVHVLFVDIVQVLESVLLRGIPDIVEIIGLSVSLILGTEIDIRLFDVIIVGAEIVIGFETEFIRVEGHGKASIGFGLDTSSNGIAIVVLSDLETIFVRHVHESSTGDNVLVVVNGPQVLGDLFDELVELLAVDTQELPFRVGIVTIQDGVRIVAKVFLVFVSLVVGVDVLKKSRRKEVSEE
jgi:hypothetical protein